MTTTAATPTPKITYIGGPRDHCIEVRPTVLSAGMARRRGYVFVTELEDPMGLSIWGGPNAKKPVSPRFYQKIDLNDHEAVLAAIAATSRAVLGAGAHPATLTIKVRAGSERAFVLAEGHIPYDQA